MAISAIDYSALITGPIYRFADWPNASVPALGQSVASAIGSAAVLQIASREKRDPRFINCL